MKPFGTGRLATLGDFYAVNLACLDDAAADDLAAAPVDYQDRRHDRGDRAPEYPAGARGGISRP